MLVPDKRSEFRVLITSRSDCVPSQIDSHHHHIFRPKPFEREQFSPWEQEQTPRENEAQEHVYHEINISVSTLIPFAMSSRPVGVDHSGRMDKFLSEHQQEDNPQNVARCHSCHQHHFLFLIFRILHKIINLSNCLSNVL